METMALRFDCKVSAVFTGSVFKKFSYCSVGLPWFLCPTYLDVEA